MNKIAFLFFTFLLTTTSSFKLFNYIKSVRNIDFNSNYDRTLVNVDLEMSSVVMVAWNIEDIVSLNCSGHIIGKRYVITSANCIRTFSDENDRKTLHSLYQIFKKFMVQYEFSSFKEEYEKLEDDFQKLKKELTEKSKDMQKLLEYLQDRINHIKIFINIYKYPIGDSIFVIDKCSEILKNLWYIHRDLEKDDNNIDDYFLKGSLHVASGRSPNYHSCWYNVNRLIVRQGHETNSDHSLAILEVEVDLTTKRIESNLNEVRCDEDQKPESGFPLLKVIPILPFPIKPLNQIITTREECFQTYNNFNPLNEITYSPSKLITTFISRLHRKTSMDYTIYSPRIFHVQKFTLFTTGLHSNRDMQGRSKRKRTKRDKEEEIIPRDLPRDRTKQTGAGGLILTLNQDDNDCKFLAGILTGVEESQRINEFLSLAEHYQWIIRVIAELEVSKVSEDEKMIKSVGDYNDKQVSSDVSQRIETMNHDMEEYKKRIVSGSCSQWKDYFVT